MLGNLGAGEHLGLYSPDSPRLLVSGFDPYPEQRNDHSYGYDSGGNLRYFATPTPRAPNGDSSIVDIAEPVHFSAARGHYTTAFDLYLSTATAGADIRYTTDGSEPTATTGFIYTGPLRLTNTVLLRAAAFRPCPQPLEMRSPVWLALWARSGTGEETDCLAVSAQPECQFAGGLPGLGALGQSDRDAAFIVFDVHMLDGPSVGAKLCRDLLLIGCHLAKRRWAKDGFANDEFRHAHK